MLPGQTMSDLPKNDEVTTSTNQGLTVMTASTRTSSFEGLDPHDPNLSRLATTTFQKTSDYLYGELNSTLDHYKLLDQMNIATTAKYADMKQIAINLSKTLESYNQMFSAAIEPYLKKIDEIEANVNKLEQAAYKLDSHTKMLVQKFKKLENK